MKVGFFLQGFPVFSETFVLNELLAFQAAKIEGEIWHVTEGDRRVVQTKVGNVKYKKHLTPQKILNFGSFFPIIAAHLYWLLHSPIRYLKTFQYLYYFWSEEHLKVFIKSMMVAKQVQKAGCTILYVHEADSPFLYAAVASKLSGIPFGVIFHTYYLFKENKFLKPKTQLANFIIFQSFYSKKYLIKKISLPARERYKIFVISSPGIDLNFFQPKKNESKKQQKIEILSVGRLEREKGFLILIKAISILKERGYQIQAKIVGEGSLRATLERSIKALSLEKEISLMGPIEHSQKLLDLFNQANMFVLPCVIGEKGHRDVHPNVIKEAMAMKKIVITTNLGGMNEFIKNRQNGFLIDKVNVDKLAKTMQEVFALDEKSKREIGDRARSTIQQDFEIKNTVEKIINLFIDFQY